MNELNKTNLHNDYAYCVVANLHGCCASDRVRCVKVRCVLAFWDRVSSATINRKLVKIFYTCDGVLK